MRVNRELRPLVADRRAWTAGHSLVRHAERTPGATFLVAPEEDLALTYEETLRAAGRVRAGLAASGAAAGDRVVVMARNRSQYVLTWLGCALGGYVEVPVNTAYEGEFLVHQVGLAEAAWLVVEDGLAARFADLAPRLPALRRAWVLDTGRQEEALDRLRAAGIAADPWPELLAAGDRRSRDAVDATVVPAATDLGAIFFTSGTTGLSKGVAMPHAQTHFFAEQIRSITRLTGEDTYLATLPMFHSNAHLLSAFPALLVGGRLVLRSRFSASRWVDQLREHDVTVTNLLGVMMDFVMRQPARPDDAANTLRCVYAAPAPPDLFEPFRRRFGVTALADAFGLSETSCPFTTPYAVPRPPGAVGLLNDEWFEVRLADPETDEEVAPGEVGELLVRPRHPWTCSLGYYRMPERTVAAWRNLWFHTGDAMRRDDEGWYYFVDRFKDSIRRRGENISSYEVERVLLGHPGVAECAVVAVPADDAGGEDEVLAVVVPDGSCEPRELLAWCAGRMPRFAIPRYVRLVDALPTTPSQKVRKEFLRGDGVTADTYRAS